MDGEVDGSADLRPCDARRGASGRCTRAVTVRSVSHPGHARASYLKENYFMARGGRDPCDKKLSRRWTGTSGT